jgi:DNA-binding CsgD family transcriptional regulator
MAHTPPKEMVASAVKTDYLVSPAEILLRHLLEQFDRESAVVRVIQRTPDVVDEVIFESTIDGIAYYLVRSQPAPGGQVNLSPRELAIGRLIAKGMPNKCIGDILEISPWTVATHLRRTFVKLGVTSRAAMVARLGEENLL